MAPMICRTLDGTGASGLRERRSKMDSDIATGRSTISNTPIQIGRLHHHAGVPGGAAGRGRMSGFRVLH